MSFFFSDNPQKPLALLPGNLIITRFYRSEIMQKTKKSIAKRFKVTGSGKLMRRKPGHRHMLRNKTQKQRNAMGKDQSVSDGFTQMLKKAIL